MEYVNPVEQQLKEAGEHLSLPPPSTKKDLLDLLDKTEQLLSFVGQAPSISMQGALVPSMGALIGDELIKHSDLDVRIAVASCLCEVARITAPEPPYKDEIMQEIFQLFMVAFGELANLTGQNYYKAVHILDSVSKVKICLLMLDLECDDLVLEMFEQFLKNIRPSHPHTVFSAMASIMTLVIEESDEIATELLSLLISHVRKEKKDISPVPWKLAEKVLRDCKVILKSYAGTIKELIKSDPGDYAEVVTILCQNATENELVISKSTKRDLITLDNGGSIKTLIHSQSKKRKYVDTERVAAVSNKINRHRLKEKQLETSQNLGTSNGSHSAKGQPKKNRNNVNQHNKPKLVQDSQEDLRITKFEEKSKDPLSQQRKDNTQSSKKKSSKKSVANGSLGKENPKKFGQDLVGCSIKVWWPLDKMFYDGAVSSFNPTDKKYKVLYADGDEEVLDLKQERWLMLEDTSRDQQQDQIAVLPSPVTTPVKHLKQKGKRKLDSAPTQEDNSNPPKRRSSAYSLRTKPTREHEIKDANTSTRDILCNSEYHKDDPVQTHVIYRGLNSSEKIIEVERDSEPNPGENLEVKRLLVSGQTTEVQQDGELKLSGKFEEKRLLESSQTIEVEQNGEPNPSEYLKEKRLLDLSHAIEMEQDGEPNLSVELEGNMLPESSEMTKTEQDAEPNPSVKLEEKRTPGSSEMEQASEQVSGELEETKMPESSEMIDVEQDCEPNQRVKLEEKKLPESSEMIEVEQACEQLSSGELEKKRQPESSELVEDGKPSPSIELLEKKLPGSSDMIEVEQDGKRIPSGELEIKRLAETNETIQCLDKSDGLVSEP
ncbi:Armadillo-type fold [Artemisia annua]|uniref:Armadillo-type fold n=1 Tax=Artemisia annua TaxID=35608 RepID=A0A2U1N8N3_ARTAN|nr:Armadillo-type fold [Artemisia annua]